MISKPSDPYDPQPVIQWACDTAIRTGKVMYVFADVAKKRWMWVCSDELPVTQKSHWKVGPNGDVSAHLGGTEITDYLYEEW